MERKLKKSAASSSSRASADSVFRFFSLPEEVCDHILSFLPVKDLVCYGTLSKKCHELQLMTPSLNFEGFSYMCNKDHFKMLNYLNRFLVLRGDKKIRRFRVDWNLALGKAASFYNELYRVITWVHNAVKCNVEELDLKLRIYEETVFQLPLCIFDCGTLRSLVLECNKVIGAPSVACSNLHYVKLRKVRIDEGFCKWISSSCKCIKELHFEEVQVENITIESSSLEIFSLVYPSYPDLRHFHISGKKLEEIVIKWTSDFPRGTSFYVSAPNLKSLKWTGNFLSRQSLGTLTCLEKAELFLNPPADDYNFDNAYEVLHSICKVKVLVLNQDTAKALYREGQVPAQFDDISYLGMFIKSWDDDVVPAMVSLLKAMPNLTTLNLKANHSMNIPTPEECRFDRRYWKSQNLSSILELKEVTIELSSGNIELELVRYILEDAKNLREMVIIYSPQQSNLIRGLKESRVDSGSIIVFQEKQRK